MLVEDENLIQKQLKANLDQIIEDRNQVAHPQAVPSFPDINKLRDNIAYFKNISIVLSKILNQKVCVFNPRPT